MVELLNAGYVEDSEWPTPDVYGWYGVLEADGISGAWSDWIENDLAGRVVEEWKGEASPRGPGGEL